MRNLPVLLAAVALVVAPRAEAQRGNLLILGSVIGEGELSAAELIDAARLPAAFVRDRALLTTEEQGALDHRLRRCGAAAPCLAALLAELGAAELLWLVLDPGREPALLTGRVLARDGRTLATRVVELPVRALRGEVVAAASRALLEKAGFQLGGRVAVETVPSGARLTVRDPTGALYGPADVLPPGVYTVEATLEDHDAAAAQLTVRAEEEARVTLRLEADRGLLGSPWFWLGAALVVAGGVTGAVLALGPGPRQAELCFPGGDAVCRDFAAMR